MLLGLRTPTKVLCKRRTDVQAPDALLVFLANRGHLAYLSKNDERGIAPGDVFVSRAQDLANFTLYPGTEWTRMVIPAGDVMAALRALGVSDISAIPAFDCAAPREFAMAVQLGIQRLITMANWSYSQRSIDYAWRQIRENITLSLLVDLPHSLSDIVARGQQRGASPRQIHRAIEFIEQFAEHDISLGDIAVAAQCSPRSLSRLFREFTGTTPMNRLRDTRLERARAQIINLPEQPLGEIAVQWGFCHGGQFAQQYKKKFGESPSETRRRH
jgi:AraC-like DNA-binding protein